MSTVEVQCPFCGEPGEVAADYDPEATGDQVFVQDCEVCCNPWSVTVHVGSDGEINVSVDRG
jgi:Cysteine-rich CPXCG